ncbi:MAG: hypothetical protein R2795_09230 [Saprospiraceae bacterium]
MDNLHAGDSLRIIIPERLHSGLFWQGMMTDARLTPLPLTACSFLIGNDKTTATSDERGRFTLLSDNLPHHFDIQQSSDQQAVFFPGKGRMVLGELKYSPAAIRYIDVHQQRRQITALAGQEEGVQMPLTNQQEVGQKATILTSPAADSTLYWSNTLASLPAYPVLSWQPLHTGKDGQATLSWVQGADAGTYRIDIVAQDTKGRRVRAIRYYKTSLAVK